MSSVNMWNFASSCIGGSLKSKNNCLNSCLAASDCSDDEVSSNGSREERLECPICWESFNLVENVPYVLWCGHTLCKNCILGLQWAVVKFPTLPIQLPLFISCPWCNLLSLRLIYKGNLRFPHKNYFLLWMVESMNGDRGKSLSAFAGDHNQSFRTSNSTSELTHGSYSSRGQASTRIEQSVGLRIQRSSLVSYVSMERLNLFLRASLVFLVRLTAKFPLVLIFLLIVVYAVPASAAILALYILITVLFALPSFLMVYFAYPSLDWLVREIIS